MVQRLEGRVAVVTGGASGIGLATARRFASEGAKVVVADLDPASGKAAADEVGGLFVQVDVTDEEQVKALFQTTVDTYGKLDIAFNNAGISPPDDDSILTTGIEAWDRVRLAEQETIFGRDKGRGAPLSGGEEFTKPDFAATVDGAPAIDAAAHVRLANPESLGGTRILRRGFNYVDGNDEVGRLAAGLFFLSFQRSPSQFITVQRALATDRLNEYIKHIGSAIFAVPPGATEGGFVGETLFG